jgi:HD-GYP domain-containing protein (c-di-GMP phosphodiesterase class II)
LIRIIEAKDQYTSTHSERVTEIAVLFGEKLKLEKSRLRDLRLAGLLHDVGKVAVPVGSLTKPASLTDSEYSEVRMHAIYSAQIVEGIENAATIADVVRYHHERWDGKGYPEGLKGEDIPELSRILSIADAFDSMFGGRAYKSALAIDEVIEELQANSGTQFAPEPTAAFIRALREDETFRRQIFSLYKDDVEESTHEGAKEDSEDFVANGTLS